MSRTFTIVEPAKVRIPVYTQTALMANQPWNRANVPKKPVQEQTDTRPTIKQNDGPWANEDIATFTDEETNITRALFCPFCACCTVMRRISEDAFQVVCPTCHTSGPRRSSPIKAAAWFHDLFQ